MAFTISIQPIFSADENDIKLLVDFEDVEATVEASIETEPTTPSRTETSLSETPKTKTTTTTITTTTTVTTVITPHKRRHDKSAVSPSQGRAKKRVRRSSPRAAATDVETEFWDIDSGLRPTRGQAFREYLGENLILQPTAEIKASRAEETKEARDRREDREFDAACQAESKFSRWHMAWFDTLLEEELTAEEATALAYQMELVW